MSQGKCEAWPDFPTSTHRFPDRDSFVFLAFLDSPKRSLEPILNFNGTLFEADFFAFNFLDGKNFWESVFQIRNTFLAMFFNRQRGKNVFQKIIWYLTEKKGLFPSVFLLSWLVRNDDILCVLKVYKQPLEKKIIYRFYFVGEYFWIP